MLWNPGAHFSALADEPEEDKDARQASAEVSTSRAYIFSSKERSHRCELMSNVDEI